MVAYMIVCTCWVFVIGFGQNLVSVTANLVIIFFVLVHSIITHNEKLRFILIPVAFNWFWTAGDCDFFSAVLVVLSHLVKSLL